MDHASNPWEGVVHLAGEDQDKDGPISSPSAKLTCDPYDNSLCWTSAAAGPEPRASRGLNSKFISKLWANFVKADLHYNWLNVCAYSSSFPNLLVFLITCIVFSDL